MGSSPVPGPRLREEMETIECDVAVIGAGPAGVAAACRAAESGARTVVLDEAPSPGGQICRHLAGADVPDAARPWLERLARSGAVVRFGASVFDAVAEDGGWRLSAETAGGPLRRPRAARRSRDGRARALPAFPGLDAAGRDGRGRRAGDGEDGSAALRAHGRRGRIGGAAAPRGGDAREEGSRRRARRRAGGDGFGSRASPPRCPAFPASFSRRRGIGRPSSTRPIAPGSGWRRRAATAGSRAWS